MSVTVAAVVVTYNRKFLLAECLQGLRDQTRQIDRIYVVDNASTDNTLSYLEELGLLSDSRIVVLQLKENLGGAGGFSIGIERAFKDRHDWIWVMDDDAEAEPSALQALLDSQVSSDCGTVAVASGVTKPDQTYDSKHHGHLEKGRRRFLCNEEYKSPSVQVDFTSFVGLLIKSSAISQVGFPRPDFFIWNDDLEYTLRLSRIGRIFLVPDSIVFHKEHKLPRGFMSRLSHGPAEDFWKNLYGLRNYRHVMLTYAHWNSINSALWLSRTLLRILFFDSHKYLRLKYALKYYRNAREDKFVNIPPAQWKEIVKSNSA